MNIRNLNKLATYLEANPKHLTFDMETFFDKGNEGLYAKTGQTRCGTVACALGHGPAAGILPKPEHMYSDTGIRWLWYGREFVTDHQQHSWCFGGAWKYCDNSIEGAAARIRYLLVNGDVPPGFREAHSIAKFIPSYQEFIRHA